MIGRSRLDQRLFTMLWIIWSISGCSHFFSTSGSTSLLVFPHFNWRRCFWISPMIGTSWLMRKFSEKFCNSQTNSGRLLLSSSGVTQSTRLVALKCFLKWSRIFSGRHFPGVGFKVVSCFVAREKSLSSTLLITDWIILAASTLKHSFLRKLAHSLILSVVFESSLELKFWATCWFFKSHGFLIF